jgi:hypothetical protein
VGAFHGNLPEKKQGKKRMMEAAEKGAKRE